MTDHTIPKKLCCLTVMQVVVFAGLYVAWKYFFPDFPADPSTDKISMYEFPFLVAMSALLASITAYHPSLRLKMETVAEIEAPKSHLLCAIAGTVIGVLAKILGSEVGYIIFGLGGLFRFKTNIGSSKETGHILLSTLVGLICGLRMPEVGFVTTVLVFILVYSLESRTTYLLFVRGLDGKPIDEVTNQYRKALEQNHCTIFSERKNLIKNQIVFVFRASIPLVRTELEASFQKIIPNEVQGVLDLETR